MIAMLLRPLFLLVLVLATLGVPPASAAERRVGASSVRVAVANVREGAVIVPRADIRGNRDRATFARKLFAQSGRAPDVVLLQEVRGSARRVARALTQTPRAQAVGASYRVVHGPGIRADSGRCDGRRPGRYSTVRDSAIVVNTRTVRGVRARGQIRTWGQWTGAGGQRVSGSGQGCAEHPWARLVVQQPGRRAVTARVASVHVAPSGPALKNRAVVTIRKRMDALHRQHPRDRVVLGGDLNLVRCKKLPRAAETRGCEVRRGHRSLLRAGYTDAVRSRNLTGPSGVLGVARRIDFIYTKDRVSASWFDRCYQAYLVLQRPCSARRSVFPVQSQFGHCQLRFLYGAPAGGCTPYHRSHYYSDHPILLATVR